MNFGEKVLNFLEKHSPEKFDQKVINAMSRVSEEARQTPGKTKNNESYEFSGESIFWMTFLGLTTFGFCYLVYLMIF